MQTRNTMKMEGCPRKASQPWEQMCLLGDHGSPQHTVQGSRATVDAASHLGPSDKDGGLRVMGMSRKGNTWLAGRGGLSAVRRFCFPLFCAHQCVLGSLRPRVASSCVVAACGPSAGLYLFSLTPCGFRQMHTPSFNSQCAPGFDWCVLTQGLRRNTTSAGSASS